jgi:hypothetical protein
MLALPLKTLSLFKSMDTGSPRGLILTAGICRRHTPYRDLPRTDRMGIMKPL